MTSNIKRITTYVKISGAWDPATSQATVGFPSKTLEIYILLKTEEPHLSTTMDHWSMCNFLKGQRFCFKPYPK